MRKLLSIISSNGDLVEGKFESNFSFYQLDVKNREKIFILSEDLDLNFFFKKKVVLIS